MDILNYTTDFFALPLTAQHIQKLPKTFFYNNFDLLSAEKKLIENPNTVVQIDILGRVNPKTANIPIFHTDSETYDEVLFLAVKMTEEAFHKQNLKMADIIHKYIPNHVMLIVYSENEVMLSIAEKRINQNDMNKRVVSQYYNSESFNPFEPNNSQSLFIDSLAFSKANTLNMQQYYLHFVQCISGLLVAKSGKTFQLRTYERSKEDVEFLNKIQDLETEITYFQNQAKKETQLSEVVLWNTKIQNHKSQIADIQQRIKL